ncbi:MAG: hypothetical protein IPO81_00385 [Kouleothrix sp.]|nr:hypothetical protein [Kouleothrix sp.]
MASRLGLARQLPQLAERRPGERGDQHEPPGLLVPRAVDRAARPVVQRVDDPVAIAEVGVGNQHCVNLTSSRCR